MATSSKRGQIPSKIQGLFISGTKFKNPQGHLYDRYSPLAYSKNFYGNKKMPMSAKETGTIKYYTKDKNGYRVFKEYRTKGIYSASYRQGNVVQLKDLGAVALQLKIAANYVDVALDNWKTVVLERALKVFNDAIDNKAFEGKSWRGLKYSTIKARKKRGTWPGGGALNETGGMKASMQIVDKEYRITTMPVTNDRDGRTRIYAGIHNAPRAYGVYKYPNGTIYRQRQFIGHSKSIDEFIRVFQDRYLFDSVFRYIRK